MNNAIISEFGENVFNDTVMQERLPSDVYATVRSTIVNGKHFNQDVAGIVANAMKQWAIEKRSYPLYTLVSTFNRNYRRKT